MQRSGVKPFRIGFVIDMLTPLARALVLQIYITRKVFVTYTQVIVPRKHGSRYGISPIYSANDTIFFSILYAIAFFCKKNYSILQISFQAKISFMEYRALPINKLC